MKTIVIVEDNEALLAAIEHALKNNFHIHAFSSPVKAVQHIAEQAQSIDIVVSDYKMPVKDGIEVLKETMKLNPAIGRILLTGYFDDVQERQEKQVCHMILDKNVMKNVKLFISEINSVNSRTE